MATSASAFAAALTEELAASLPRCTARREFDGEVETCDDPAGSAASICEHGHERVGALCPDHSTGLGCWECWNTGRGFVPLTVTTEVA
jgi:hypothetical protein